MYILMGVVMFMILVLIHEFGHFITAKKSGAKVLEFGLGMPPKIFSLGKDSSGTEYTVNLIPLGGFVRIKGEDPDDKGAFLAEDSFIKQAFWKKIMILFAGVSLNFLLAWIIFTSLFAVGIKPLQIVPDQQIPISVNSYLMPTESFAESQGLITKKDPIQSPDIKQIMDEGLADQSGILSGDKIVSIQGQAVTNTNLSKLLDENKSKEMEIIINRDGQELTKYVDCQDKDVCLLGVVVPSDIESINNIDMSIGQAMMLGLKEIGSQTRLTFHMLGKLGKGLFSMNGEETEKAVENVAGPVGAVSIGENLFKQGGFGHFLAFAGMISLALAIFNILPIPALDGGRALGVTIQKVFNIQPEKYYKFEGYINIIIFVLLMSFGVYVIFMDLARFWSIDPFGMM